jgi:TatD DNase family protein
MFFDSHAHYDDERFNADRDELLQNLKNEDVSYVINIGSCVETSLKSVELSKKYDFIYAALGIHPHCVEDIKDNDISVIERETKNNKVVAIGEIGLDYHYDNSPRELQKHWFSQQLKLAKKVCLPVIIHDREAHQDAMNIVKKEDVSSIGGVFHCYSGSVEMANELIEMGFYISIPGTITFKNAKKVKDVVKNIPIEKMLIETDCPYLAPEPYRGKRNYSAYLKYIAQEIAQIKEISVEEVAEITLANAKHAFHIY